MGGGGGGGLKLGDGGDDFLTGRWGDIMGGTFGGWNPTETFSPGSWLGQLGDKLGAGAGKKIPWQEIYDRNPEIARPDFNNIPGAPGQTMMNPDGSLRSQFVMGAPKEVTPGKISVGDLGAGDAQKFLTNFATSSGPSDWLKLQNADLDRRQMTALDDVTRGTAGQNIAAQNQLASSGGMTSGARERLADSAQKSAWLGMQNVRNQGEGQRNQLAIQDEANKLNLLPTAAGLEQDLGKFNKTMDFNSQSKNIGNQMAADQFNVDSNFRTGAFNIGNTMGEIDKQRAAGLDTYKTGMQTRAANIAAEGMAERGGGKK